MESKKIVFALLVLVLMQFAAAQSGGASQIKISLVNQDPDPVEPGGIVDVRVRFENVGAGVITGVIALVDPDFPFFLASGEDREQDIGTLDARVVGATADIIKWRLKVADDVPPGTYDLDVNYRVGSSVVKGKPLRIDVESSEAIISIKEVSMEPDKVQPGQQAILSLVLVNQADITLENIKVKLDLSKVPFAPLGSTDEISIDRLKRRESKEISFTLIVLPDAESKVHKVSVSLTYFDNKGTQTNRTNQVGIIVDEKPDYIINLEDSSLILPNIKGDVVVSISNRGIAEIKFVTLEILPGESYIILSNPKIYLGNLESDDFETAEFTVFPEATGELRLNLEMTYKDSFNRPYTEKVSVPVQIYPKREAKKLGLISSGGNKSWIILVILIAGGIWWWRKKKR